MRVRKLASTVVGLMLALGTGAAEPGKGGFSVSSLDTSANPCEDFFQYSCGGWIEANPIPSDEPRWGTFNALADRNREVLKSILEEAVTSSKPTKEQALIGGGVVHPLPEQRLRQTDGRLLDDRQVRGTAGGGAHHVVAGDGGQGGDVLVGDERARPDGRHHPFHREHVGVEADRLHLAHLADHAFDRLGEGAGRAC